MFDKETIEEKIKLHMNWYITAYKGINQVGKQHKVAKTRIKDQLNQ